MKGLLLLLPMAVLCGCAAETKPLPPALVASTSSVGVGASSPRELPPIATPGEQMGYRVSIHGLVVADFFMSVGQVTSMEGVETIVVQSEVKSSQVAAWLKPVQDEYTSWIDRKSGRSVAFSAREISSKKDQVEEETEARFSAERIAVQLVRGDGEPRNEDQVIAGAGGYDLNSFLMFLRAWEAEPGARIEADVMRSRFVWRAQVVVGGYENLDTAMGEIAVVRYDGESVRLVRDGAFDPTSDRRRWSVWVSDDADRVPVKLVAHTDYGDIKMELVAYQPGKTTAR